MARSAFLRSVMSVKGDEAEDGAVGGGVGVIELRNGIAKFRRSTGRQGCARPWWFGGRAPGRRTVGKAIGVGNLATVSSMGVIRA